MRISSGFNARAKGQGTQPSNPVTIHRTWGTEPCSPLPLSPLATHENKARNTPSYGCKGVRTGEVVRDHVADLFQVIVLQVSRQRPVEEAARQAQCVHAACGAQCFAK